MPDRPKVYYRLREWRTARGLSQAALADRVGCTAMAISLIERDKNAPSSSLLVALAKALNISIDDLVAEPSPSPQNWTAQV